METNDVMIRHLLDLCRKSEKSDIWLYSGYRFEDLQGREILDLVDVLVDGPFDEKEKDAGLAFRGSRNQRIIRMEGKTI